MKNYSNVSKEEIIERFLKEKQRIGAKSSYSYKKNKCKDSPSWDFVARTCGVRTWEQLCDVLNIPKLSDRNNKAKLIVESHTKLEQEINNIELKYKNLINCKK